MSVYRDAGNLLQRTDFGGRLGADAVEAHVGQPRMDAGKDLAAEPQHCIGIRRMAEAAHEDQVPALRERCSASGEFVQV